MREWETERLRGGRKKCALKKKMYLLGKENYKLRERTDTQIHMRMWQWNPANLFWIKRFRWFIISSNLHFCLSFFCPQSDMVKYSFIFTMGVWNQCVKLEHDWFLRDSGLAGPSNKVSLSYLVLSHLSECNHHGDKYTAEAACVSTSFYQCAWARTSMRLSWNK